MTEYDEYGYIVDEYGHQIGWCNSCGEEAEADTECCEDAAKSSPTAKDPHDDDG